MNLDYNDDQRLLRDTARKFLADKAPLTVARRVLEDDDATHDAGLWRAIVEMGWVGTAVPEEYGGLGLGYVELCVLAEELGRSLAPVPFSSSVYLATEALLLAGSESQKRAWLPRLATGEVVGTLAFAEGTGVPGPRTIDVTAEGGRLSGRKQPVPDGGIAGMAVVVAREAAGSLSLHIAELDDDSVTRAPVAMIDPSRGHAAFSFDRTPAEPLGAAGQGEAILEALFDRAAVLFAFEQIGGADAALEMARDYALNRFAFGRPIGSFQAIKHKLADVYIANQLARSNGYYGAWALASDAAELPLAAAASRIGASEAYHLAAKECIQTHGGMGFTWEFDCHLYYRRAKLLALALGSQRRWKDRLVATIERRNAA